MLFPYHIEIKITRKPWITFSLIGINLLIFLLLLFLGEERRTIIFLNFGFIPEELGKIYPLLTSLFLHLNWTHLIGNLYFLYFFGIPVENHLGGGKFLIFYLLAGIMGNLLHAATVTSFYSDLPSIGASGAISGVLGGFVVLFPRVTVKTLLFLILFLRPLVRTVELPAIWFVGIWFLFQFLQATLSLSLPEVTSVAYWAHLGGFVFGMLALGYPRLEKGWRNWREKRLQDKKVSLAYLYAREGSWEKVKNLLQSIQPSERRILPLSILSSFIRGDETQGEEKLRLYWEQVRKKGEAGEIVNAYYLSLALGKYLEFTIQDYLKLGRSFLRMGMVRESIRIFREGLLKCSPEESPPLLYELGETLLHQGAVQEAENIFRLLIERFPETPQGKSARFILKEEG